MVFLPHWPKIIGERPIDLGLERVNALLEALGNPHHKLPPVVHIAGTNGKGSTLAFIRCALEAAGYKVHVYTSPHILQFNERIVLAGQAISDDYLTEIMDECRIASEETGIDVTFFEGTTVGAMLAFSRVEADIVLLETGMGGRLDATNVIEKPRLTIITPISLDHMEYLGETLRHIAFEKAGILKAGVPSIVSMQDPDALDILNKVAQKVGSELSTYEYDWGVERKEDESLLYKSSRGDLELTKPNLAGLHQYINAGTAIAALQELSSDFNITSSHIKEALEKTEWIGRLQRIKEGKCASLLTSEWELWVDGAHNEAGAEMLAHMLDQWSDKPTYIICGFTRGRDPESILRYFVGKAEHVIGVLVQTEPSAQTGEKIAESAKKLGFTVGSSDYVEDAVTEIVQKYPEGGRILCCGSLYLISDVLSKTYAQ
jgi:dihydrofolate synthase/folylpolyglutamate synthase